jgi:hypothetical protein
MKKSTDAECISPEDGVLICCQVCGQILERLTLMEKIRDSGFARRVYLADRAHRPACILFPWRSFNRMSPPRR